MGGHEIATTGYGASKNVERRSGDGPYGKVEIEETDGSSRRQKEFDFSVLVFGSIWLVVVVEEHSTLATQYWQKELGPEDGIANKQKGG